MANILDLIDNCIIFLRLVLFCLDEHYLETLGIIWIILMNDLIIVKNCLSFPDSTHRILLLLKGLFCVVQDEQPEIRVELPSAKSSFRSEFKHIGRASVSCVCVKAYNLVVETKVVEWDGFDRPCAQAVKNVALVQGEVHLSGFITRGNPRPVSQLG